MLSVHPIERWNHSFWSFFKIASEFDAVSRPCWKHMTVNRFSQLILNGQELVLAESLVFVAYRLGVLIKSAIFWLVHLKGCFFQSLSLKESESTSCVCFLYKLRGFFTKISLWFFVWIIGSYISSFTHDLRVCVNFSPCFEWLPSYTTHWRSEG